MFSPARCNSLQVISVLKFLLFAYSAIFLVIGIIMFSFGLWGLINLKDYFALAPKMTTHAVSVLIGIGCTIFVIGIFGFFATWKGSRLTLNVYAVLLTLVYIAELVAGISGFTYRHEIKAKIKEAFDDALKEYVHPSPATAAVPPAVPPAVVSAVVSTSAAVDAIQGKLQCCGVENFKDWSANVNFATSGVPRSCCKNQANCDDDKLKAIDTAEELVHPVGCFALVTDTVGTNMAIIAGCSFGLAFFQLIGLSMASFLSQYLKFNHYEIP